MDISLVLLARKAVKQLQEFILSKKEDPGALSSFFSAFSIASIKPCFQNGLHMSDFPQLVVAICEFHSNSEIVLKKGIQLLGNMTVQNKFGKDKVWKICYPDFINQMLNSSYEFTELICFLIFNCLDKSRARELVSSQRGIDLISRLLFEMTKDNSGDFLQLLLSRILLDYEGTVVLYSLFNENRNFSTLLLLLDFILQSNTFNILSLHESTHLCVCTNLIEFLCRDFLLLTPTLLQSISILEEGITHEDGTLIKAEIFKSILAILAVFSGFSELLTHLQSREVLLRECLSILEKLSKYSQPKIPSNTTQTSEVTKLLYGIKQHDMQLIANMLYSNPHNVNLVYEDKTKLVLILNHCRADMMNPFLTQWVVLAVRNLCQDKRVQIWISELGKLDMDSSEIIKKAGLSN